MDEYKTTTDVAAVKADPPNYLYADKEEARAKARKRGRPPLPWRKVRLTVLVRKETDSQLRRLAHQNGCSLGEMVDYLVGAIDAVSATPLDRRSHSAAYLQAKSEQNTRDAIHGSQTS